MKIIWCTKSSWKSFAISCGQGEEKVHNKRRERVLRILRPFRLRPRCFHIKGWDGHNTDGRPSCVSGRLQDGWTSPSVCHSRRSPPPRCAEGDVPTAANLNFYGCSRSHVGRHCDDEPLFGSSGDPKLIVSLSLGSSATFKWKAKSCSDCEASSCRLHHGDLLVMDGACQDENLHCTSPVQVDSVPHARLPLGCRSVGILAYLCARFARLGT